ncbi:hypothetical protein CapIbe_023129 [Capra ibex]
MPKRKVTFQGVRDEDDEDDISVPKKKLVDPVAGVGGPGSRFEGKHSLDSDEKEKNDDEGSSKYDMLASEDVGGQEAATLSSDGGVWIILFKLQEEIEEGHFEADGNYFLNWDAQI